MTKRRRYITWLVLGALLLLAGAIATYLILTNGQARYNHLNDVRKETSLVIVLPTTLPRGSTITYHPTYDKKNQSITTRISISGHGITFSQQKRPGTDLKQVDAVETFLVNAGSVYVLKGEAGRLQAIVETTDSWLMVNADAKIGTQTFRAMLESLDTI